MLYDIQGEYDKIERPLKACLMHIGSFVPRSHPAFCHLQYGKVRSRGERAENEVSTIQNPALATSMVKASMIPTVWSRVTVGQVNNLL